MKAEPCGNGASSAKTAASSLPGGQDSWTPRYWERRSHFSPWHSPILRCCGKTGGICHPTALTGNAPSPTPPLCLSTLSFPPLKDFPFSSALVASNPVSSQKKEVVPTLSAFNFPSYAWLSSSLLAFPHLHGARRGCGGALYLQG